MSSAAATPPTPPRIAVIGGGWAGIAAAVDLTLAGRAVTLFEAGRVLGGRARAVTVDGRRLDNGQHILLGAYCDTLDLMRRIGLDPTAAFRRHPLQVLDNTGFRLALPRLPAPLNLAWGLLAARGVGLGEKLRTALWMDGLKRRRFAIDGEPSVAAWLDAAGQTGVLRRHLWEPLCLAALNTPAERASARRFANVLRDSLGSPRRADTDLLLPRSDLGRLLPEQAARWLAEQDCELRLGHRVRGIAAASDGIAIDGERFAAAVLAVAPQHLPALWPAAELPAFDYEPIATVYLQFAPHATPRLPFPLFNLLGGSGQWLVERADGILSAVLSGRGAWEKLDDEALARTIQDELGCPERAVWHKVIREKRATFSCRPGLPATPADSGHPRLFLAGDYTWTDYPATLEGAIRSGRRAGRRAASC